MDIFFQRILLFSLAISTALPQVVSIKDIRYTLNLEKTCVTFYITILLRQYNGLKNILQPYGYDVIQNSQTGLLPWFQNAMGKKHA